MKPPSACHPDRPSFVKGICKKCYEHNRALNRAEERRKIIETGTPEQIEEIRSKEREKSRRYREANPERHREKERAWRQANRDRLCEQRKARRATRDEDFLKREREKVMRYRVKHSDKCARREMFRSARQRSQKLGVPFSITLDDIIVPEFCPVLPWIRICPGVGKGRQQNDAPSLDRMIPELGYVPGNVRVISWRANDLKRNGSLREFEAIVEYVRAIELSRREVA